MAPPPPPADDARLALQQTWTAAGITAQALTVDASGTIAGPDLASGMTRTLVAHLAELPGLVGAEIDPQDVILGRGGRGVVELARQRSLTREVAVKTLHDADRGEAAVAELVREARVTGALEHPNVVPVHALGRDPQGGPLIVMKRVEGASWESRLLDGRGTPEHLERHLDVLVDVCNAVHFAHTRGVLHRDLKPANVMLGDFGEVYVVDWGLAVDLGDARIPGLPTRADIDSIAGTPCYMGPEQAAAEGARFGPWTDVYLLGAALHEILTGGPRHDGGTLFETCLSAFESAPVDYGDGVPGELADICNRACHKEPEQRFHSAEALRDAIQTFRLHQASVALSDEALQRLEQARDLIAQPGYDEETGELLAAARFGFEHALAGWADNPAARAGLEATLNETVDWDLGRGALDSAKALLDQLDSARPELRDRVATLRGQLGDRAQELAALDAEAHERDLDAGASARRLLAVVVAAFVVTEHIALGLLRSLDVFTVDALTYGLVQVAFAAASQLVVARTWRTVFPNRASRQLYFATLAIAGGAAGLYVVATALGVGLDVTLALCSFALGAQMVGLAITVDRRLLWVSGAMLALALVMPVAPSASLYLTGAVQAVLFGGTGLIWRRDGHT